jgi:hypothetical protein
MVRFRVPIDLFRAAEKGVAAQREHIRNEL